MQRPFASLVAAGIAAAAASCQPRPGAQRPEPVPSAVAAPVAPVVAPEADEAVPLGPLPAGVHPTHETLALEIDPAADRFRGTAEIAIHLDAPRRRIWLHGRGLAVSSAAFVLPSGAAIPARWEELDPSGVVRVSAAPEAPAPSGEVWLRVAFEAAYDAQLVGVYKVTTPAGPAVFSKFEAIYARRAFPCFDEPAFKLPFEVSLTVPASADAIGNMPVAERSDAGGGRARIRFQPTPPLPSYLIAFAVGAFDRRETSLPPSSLRPAALPITAVAVRGRGDDTAYALAEERALLAEQERYFGIGFPFPKLDLVAVPDFQSGAMENAGAITFRDSRLLIDDRVSSVGDRSAVTSVLAHETAHQWFGDYVTMRWWDDLWLNEGFATFLDLKTLRAARPELEAELDMVNRIDMVMNLDGLASARQVRQPIRTAHDITNAFDGITYEKGAAVLGMVEHAIGDEPFRSGLHAFLTAHARGNATTADLIAALAASAHRDLDPLMSSFLDQPGVPMIAASARCEAGRGSIELRQAPWRSLGATEPSEAHWTVPVCARYGAGGKVGQACTELNGPTAALALPVCADWIMANADAAGYYRAALSPPDLTRLRDRGMARLSTAERIQLGHDLEAAFASGATPGGDVLRALEPFARDPHGAVAAVPIKLLAQVDDAFLGAPGDRAKRAALRARVSRLYAPAVAALGWTASPTERRWRRQFRVALLEFLFAEIDDPAVRTEAARRGRRLLGLDRDRIRHPDAVPPDLADVALAAAVRGGGAELFDAVVADLRQSGDAQVRERDLTALAHARDPELVRRALALALDPDLRKNERLLALRVLLGDADTRAAAWTWLTEHFDALVPLLPDRFAGRIPMMVRMCDRAEVAQVRAFFAPRIEPLTGGPRNLAQALEAGEQCAARVAAQRDSVLGYVDGR